mmetsp:Transcript_123474/g.348961  ORF Transcript_123474/g.348961 Transcript_123474/m.348961 type:complete len:1112 (-) Transcript_123474:92-3427(-)
MDVASAEDALVAWVNACGVLQGTSIELENLEDGMVLLEVLQHFVPEAFDESDADASSKPLEALLSAGVRLRAALGRLDKSARCAREHASVKTPQDMLETVFLASINGSRREDAVQVILDLGEERQATIRTIIEQNDHGSEGYSSGEAEAEDTFNPTARRRSAPAQPERKTTTDSMQSWVEKYRSLRCRVAKEEHRCRKLKLSERETVDRIHREQIQCYEEEQRAVNAVAKVGQFTRNEASELRLCKQKIAAMTTEVSAVGGYGANAQEESMQLLLKQKHAEESELADEHRELETEIHAVMALGGTDKGHASNEMTEMQAMMNACTLELHAQNDELQASIFEEQEVNQIVLGLWKSLHEMEALTEYRKDELVYYRRLFADEARSQHDADGMLEFRKMELRMAQRGDNSMSSGDARHDGVASGAVCSMKPRKSTVAVDETPEVKDLKTKLMELRRTHESFEESILPDIKRYHSMDARVHGLKRQEIPISELGFDMNNTEPLQLRLALVQRRNQEQASSVAGSDEELRIAEEPLKYVRAQLDAAKLKSLQHLADLTSAVEDLRSKLLGLQDRRRRLTRRSTEVRSAFRSTHAHKPMRKATAKAGKATSTEMALAVAAATAPPAVPMVPALAAAPKAQAESYASVVEALEVVRRESVESDQALAAPTRVIAVSRERAVQCADELRAAKFEASSSIELIEVGRADAARSVALLGATEVEIAQLQAELRRQQSSMAVSVSEDEAIRGSAAECREVTVAATRASHKLAEDAGPTAAEKAQVLKEMDGRVAQFEWQLLDAVALSLREQEEALRHQAANAAVAAAAAANAIPAHSKGANHSRHGRRHLDPGVASPNGEEIPAKAEDSMAPPESPTIKSEGSTAPDFMVSSHAFKPRIHCKDGRERRRDRHAARVARPTSRQHSGPDSSRVSSQKSSASGRDATGQASLDAEPVERSPPMLGRASSMPSTTVACQSGSTTPRVSPRSPKSVTDRQRRGRLQALLGDRAELRHLRELSRTSLELVEIVSMQEHQLAILKVQEERRGVTMKRELRVITSVLHEIILRYHLLLSQHRFLIEDLERDGVITVSSDDPESLQVNASSKKSADALLKDDDRNAMIYM